MHTFIRPLGGYALGYLALADSGPVLQNVVGLLTGSIALDFHLTKATTRVAINTSPEPVANMVASVMEDVSVTGILILIAKHPVVVSIFVICFILSSIWFLKRMFKFLKKIVSFSKGEERRTGRTENIDFNK